jgi:hypothetical protein
MHATLSQRGDHECSLPAFSNLHLTLPIVKLLTMR